MVLLTSMETARLMPHSLTLETMERLISPLPLMVTVTAKSMPPQSERQVSQLFKHDDKFDHEVVE
jgi:hypothetical protein